MKKTILAVCVALAVVAVVIGVVEVAQAGFLWETND
jgi:hypothetical protein